MGSRSGWPWLIGAPTTGAGWTKTRPLGRRGLAAATSAYARCLARVPPGRVTSWAMDAAALALIGVLLGGLIASISAIALEYFRGQHESSLDSARRTDDRRLERERFERRTLVDAQDALNALGTLLTEYLLVLTGQPAAADLALRYNESLSHVNKLLSRVADEELRISAHSALAKAAVVTASKDKATASTAFQDYGTASGKFLRRSGELILSTFRADTSGTGP